MTKLLNCYSQPHRVNRVTVGRIWNFRDITERVVLESKLEYQATHDALTKLPNRVLLNDRILHAIAVATRYNKHFAVLFFDLDRFKLVNDSLSHEAGDELLSAIANRLSSLLRKEDTLARLGGDEFVILISGLSNDENVIGIAQKVLASFEQPFQIFNHELMITPSIGVSLYPRDGKTINALLKNADLAMYQAKEHGGNQFRFYTHQLNQQSCKRLNQESELWHAIANNEFFLLYQPQFDIENKTLLGVEALIRWQHPKKGIILPLDFIPIAEESGLIVPIGEWVIREVCRQITEWRKRGFSYVPIAVNTATKQLKQANFSDTVKDILQEYQVEPEYLEIEITENVILTNAEVQQMIHKLKKIGVKIVLDDFGTGNSSLNYLKQIQIDRLKIDQSFVKNISRSRRDEVIIQAIIAMGRSLNFKVLAEGVETQKQINFLKQQNCDEIQGFFISKPVSSKAIEKILKKQQRS